MHGCTAHCLMPTAAPKFQVQWMFQAGPRHAPELLPNSNMKGVVMIGMDLVTATPACQDVLCFTTSLSPESCIYTNCSCQTVAEHVKEQVQDAAGGPKEDDRQQTNPWLQDAVCGLLVQGCIESRIRPVTHAVNTQAAKTVSACRITICSSHQPSCIFPEG